MLWLCLECNFSDTWDAHFIALPLFKTSKGNYSWTVWTLMVTGCVIIVFARIREARARQGPAAQEPWLSLQCTLRGAGCPFYSLATIQDKQGKL